MNRQVTIWLTPMAATWDDSHHLWLTLHYVIYAPWHCPETKFHPFPQFECLPQLLGLQSTLIHELKHTFADVDHIAPCGTLIVALMKVVKK